MKEEKGTIKVTLLPHDAEVDVLRYEESLKTSVTVAALVFGFASFLVFCYALFLTVAMTFS